MHKTEPFSYARANDLVAKSIKFKYLRGITIWWTFGPYELTSQPSDFLSVDKPNIEGALLIKSTG